MSDHAILLISLGCDKNLVDSEFMLGTLSEQGYTFTDDEETADIIVINTCCFIHDAREESINTILEMAERKKSGQVKALIVTGCLAQRYREEILKEIPEVDVIVGITAQDSITEAIDSVMKTAVTDQGISQATYFQDINRLPAVEGKRVVTTGGHYAYLKIAEGCDKYCTYCIIPRIRGNYRSVPMEQLTAEAARLAEGGVRELILVAQETTLYGQDLYGKKMLPDLLIKLCEIEGLKWIRILYCYPEEITDELIEVIRREDKICHYLDIPIQHGSDDVLRRMGRKTDGAHIRSLVGRLRAAIPDICLRTTMITGFPGETERDHKETKELVKELRFDRLGVFTFSPEEDTPAAVMNGQITDSCKKRRRTELMELQQKIAFERADEMIGRQLTVMIEGRTWDEEEETASEVYVARTYRDAPDVDGLFFLETNQNLVSGDFITVRVTGSYEYDLTGEICNEFAK